MSDKNLKEYHHLLYYIALQTNFETHLAQQLY